METINRLLGKLLLIAALALTALAIVYYPKPAVEEVPGDARTRQVCVELDKSKLAGASKETFFLASAPEDSGKNRFVPEQKVTVFVPIDLDLPPAGVLAPPQLLPDGGPSLEGTRNLPRWGEEFPAIVLAPAGPAGTASAPVAPAVTPGVAAPPAARTPLVPAPAAKPPAR